MEKTKILIADDNSEIREVISVLLSSEGYEVIEAKNGEEAIEKANEDIDLFILDIMMPKVNGYQACIGIRKKSHAPVLFLSAKGAESDKTLGFSSGADDYLTKPFSYNELTARVKAMLRRYHIYKGKEALQEEKSILKFTSLTIDEINEKVFIDNTEIELTDIEYQILHLLATHRQQIFSLEKLYETIWNEDYYYTANNTVMVHMRNLRKKIEKDPQNPKIIKTIWGKGYRFE
ncbi:two-component system OmpR family response regulator [Breznakia sp. PF5-3]|uniref:response regulator transcription factor n=1 Tax=unclassified Breznakia TaxID=2623764 RepID=UPI0024062173|nr:MULTISPECIES: response regulator transcription factor [unclassified Breznakia]MDL2276649.1 response regulator transcription factor [Breznakia sp. OttesenSCG-928-G09]MDF9824823.1 two-component system OmpR family response regulator [Breznakia sp. PM6-1]MDF9835215.1 two-component system OmpR family response regulator [Breznakia sp. PF5-3]MDF9837327.1 two-component system OmpR family response regulator [Breznakia sp. PFB2-8]MDF9859749.1 two-component system OmpR family response regulator [Brezn